MNKLMDIFDWQRFIRVFVNDLMLLQARRVLFASLGLASIGVIVYLSNANENPGANVELAVGTFGALLLGGGQIFTSMIFNDMHHPLERFHYLMLPCSNLERFVSRYLVTAPLFLLYAIVFFKIFEVVANFVVTMFFEVPAIPALDLGTQEAQRVILAYFIAHVFVYTGAIWFRSYSLIKTMVASTVFWTVCGIVSFLAMRIIYWDSFISFFEMNPEGPYVDIRLDWLVDGEDEPEPWLKAVFTLFLLWMLFLAYLGLEEHEVQDGL